MDKQIQDCEIYVPERLFLHNLFKCYGCPINTLLDELNDNIIQNIEIEMSMASIDLNKYQDINGSSLIPISFKRFVADMMKRKECNNTTIPNYCLLTYYYKIKGLTNSITSKANHLNIVDEGNDEDLIIFENFKKCFKYHTELLAGAVSDKQLKRILNLQGTIYNDKEKLLVEYLIKNVIPHLHDSANKDFITSIKNKPYNELLYFDIETSKRKLYIKGDDQFETNVNMFFNGKFTELYNMSEIDYEEYYDEIGNLLLEIFQKLVSLYKSDNISNTPNQDDQHDSPDIQSKTLNDNEMFLYDSTISSHIIRFMKWLPMIPEDFQNIGFMQSVDNVIEKIRCQVLENLENEHSYDKFKHSQDSIFISNNINLRKILIPALHNEFCIHSQFHEYYGFPYYKEGDIINE